jgi:HlyD family secretion protein
VAVVQAANEVKRSEQLAGQGFVAPTKLETDRLNAVAAQKELEAARQEAHVAGHEVEQARAALMAVEQPIRLGSRAFVVRAPVAGSVLRVLQSSETSVAIGTPIVELGDVAALEIVAELLTTDALQAKPGSAVRIERWGGPGTLQGRVRRIEPAAFTKVSALGVEEQRVNVIGDFVDSNDMALGDGYRIEARIVVWEGADVLKVPMSALFRYRDAWHVFVAADGRARRAAVEIGERGSVAAEVRSGLSAGERVILHPSDQLDDGTRIIGS